MRSHAPLRFLLVEDDDVDRSLISRFFTKIREDYELVETASLSQARLALANSKFDCVLLDYHLDGETGLDLIPAIIEHRVELCPVILISLREAEALVGEAMRKGVADYICKANLTIERLQNVIKDVLSRAALEEERRRSERELHRQAEEMRYSHELALRASAEKAEAAAKAKALFVANMSHEIRTPLNAVIGLTHLLAKSDLDSEQAPIVENIKRASKSLLKIVNNVLDTSKLDSGQIILEKIPFSLTETFDEIVNLCSIQVEDKPVVLTADVDPNLPELIIGDPARLHQIILNLVTNATKFTDYGSVELSAKLAPNTSNTKSANDKSRIRISVEDTGIGIDAGVLDGLFEPFVQADSSTTRSYRGTGLGLTLSRELVQLMGGEIGAGSAKGIGSIFWIDLPLHPYDGPALAPQIPPVRSETTTSAKFEGMRILLVDDCDINLEVGAGILTYEGALVRTATNGLDAVNMLLSDPDEFDIVLMDLQMPILDGEGAFRRMQSALGNKRPPVLALTASAKALNDGDIDPCGMEGVVPKPFEVDSLVSMMIEATTHAPPPGGVFTR